MTPTELRQIINFLFEGRGGQTELSRLVRCNDSTIRRYLSGSREIPDYLSVILAHAYLRKKNNLALAVDADQLIENMLGEIRSTQKQESPVL